MKNGNKFRLLALTLALTMSLSLITPAEARWGSSSGSSSGNWWTSFWDAIFGKDEEETPTEPDLSLIEDETTVTEGTQLRASTYALNDAPSAQADASTTIKYFPVTLYDYDERINKATHQAEVDAALAGSGIDSLTQWNGIYFGGNNNEHGVKVKTGDSYTYSTGNEVNYTYKKQYVNYDSNKDYSTYTDGSYYVEVDGDYYVVTNISCTRSWNWLGYSYSYEWIITHEGGSTKSSESSITLYTREESNTASTEVLEYANWNKWTGDYTSNGSNSGNRIYSGLVESTLDAQKNISFTKTDGGVFNSDASVKDIYTNVGLPFKYDSSTKYYTFDANEFGAYFHDSTAASNTNLYYSSTPQSQDFRGQDNREKGWYPFDDTTNVEASSADYFFGMNATIPFTMTTNGRMSPNDNNSDPIVFNFSGDDDVWVFIDGKLVLDIGGVRNMLNGSIDFAENTWTIEKPKDQNGGDLGDASDSPISLTGQLFDDENGVGILNQTRETFAATDSHELTVFYLERGAGSSNCKIEFNLPMKDSVSVQKIANQSKTADGTLSPLDAEEQTMVNNTSFGFTLYKESEPVKNTNFSLLNESGQYLETRSTDANGHFELKAGQTAKFVGTINSDSYHVVEDQNPNFQTPDYTYTANIANGVEETASNADWTSMTVTSKGGSEEAEDSIIFTCTNYLDAELPNPTSSPADDKIVIDYGLPVIIDVLANDVHKGDGYTLTSVSDDKYGEATITEDGKIRYELKEQLSNVEVLTYTATATNGAQTNSGTAKVYIIPATSMYYEEDFSNLVTFNGAWENIGTAQTDPQEPGVVGTVGDSPYGSDAAYLNDRGDSNGSSKYINTEDAQVSFSYTFTGTGTSFFARTSETAAYMRVVVKDNDGTVVSDTRRNNIYKAVDGTDVGTLYNIPVYTYEADNYGTYTVTVILMRANATLNRGSEFYLDGIKVINPLDETDTNVSIAKAAYATDGEASMTIATLRQKLLNDAAIEEEVIDEDGNTTTHLKWDGENFVIFTDTNGEIKSAEEYKSNGPKEEVYLNQGQSVTFSLTDWDPNTNKIYLGIKAPIGSGSVSINGKTLNINNAIDCYYDISDYANITTEDGVKIATFEIKATSSLISVTNIKVTGSKEFTIVDKDDINADEDLEVQTLDIDADSLNVDTNSIDTIAPTNDETANVNPDSNSFDMTDASSLEQ